MPCSERLAAASARPSPVRRNVVVKKLFGGVGSLLKGNMLVGFWKDALIVRIGADEAEDWLEPHIREFDVTGKPMKGWVLVDPPGLADDDQLAAWIERATKFVGKLPAK